jgi:hypothetical protein
LADYPCDFHLARYTGPSSRVYLNVYREEEKIQMKASVCGDCLAELMACWLERALHRTPDGGWDPGSDGQELDVLWTSSDELPDAFKRRR